MTSARAPFSSRLLGWSTMQSMDPGHLFTAHSPATPLFRRTAADFCTNYAPQEHDEDARQNPFKQPALWKCETSGGGVYVVFTPGNAITPSRNSSLVSQTQFVFWWGGGNFIWILKEVERIIEEAQNCLFPKWRIWSSSSSSSSSSRVLNLRGSHFVPSVGPGGGGRDASQGRTQFSTDCHKAPGERCRVAGAGHYMIGSNQVPGVLPLACNSVTGSTDLGYRLVHNNTQQQPEFEILTRDWPVYSRAHTDEATVGQKVLELAEGRGILAIWQKGETKSKHMRLASICSSRVQ